MLKSPQSFRIGANLRESPGSWVRRGQLVSGSGRNESTRFALASGPFDHAHAAVWIAPLVALGSCVWRYSQTLDGKQLVVVISVPVRDFAAALVGIGWAVASPPPVLEAPAKLLRRLETRTPVRVVLDQSVISGYFTRLDEMADPARALIDGSAWLVPKIRAVTVLSSLEDAVRKQRQAFGSLGAFFGINVGWAERLAEPPADLALVGTAAWIREDLDAYLGVEGEEGGIAQIADILLPEGDRLATWSTRLYSTAKFATDMPSPSQIRAVVLDGSAAIKYLAEVEAPVVFAVVDRSVADDTAAEIVVQQRNTRGDTVSLRKELGWRAPVGVEAFAFTVAI